jgi:hypothetical protein
MRALTIATGSSSRAEKPRPCRIGICIVAKQPGVTVFGFDPTSAVLPSATNVMLAPGLSSGMSLVAQAASTPGMAASRSTYVSKKRVRSAADEYLPPGRLTLATRLRLSRTRD